MALTLFCSGYLPARKGERTTSHFSSIPPWYPFLDQVSIHEGYTFRLPTLLPSSSALCESWAVAAKVLESLLHAFAWIRSVRCPAGGRQENINRHTTPRQLRFEPETSSRMTFRDNNQASRGKPQENRQSPIEMSTSPAAGGFHIVSFGCVPNG